MQGAAGKAALWLVVLTVGALITPMVAREASADTAQVPPKTYFSESFDVPPYGNIKTNGPATESGGGWRVIDANGSRGAAIGGTGDANDVLLLPPSTCRVRHTRS